MFAKTVSFKIETKTNDYVSSANEHTLLDTYMHQNIRNVTYKCLTKN